VLQFYISHHGCFVMLVDSVTVFFHSSLKLLDFKYLVALKDVLVFVLVLNVLQCLINCKTNLISGMSEIMDHHIEENLVAFDYLP
jgi:hypothetical protein